MSEGEGAHLGWVMAHPRQRVRAARVFISPKAASVPDLLVILGACDFAAHPTVTQINQVIGGLRSWCNG